MDTLGAGAFWGRAAAVAMAAYLLLPSSFPHPYTGVPAEVVTPDALALFPSFPANLSGPFTPNHHLVTRATRMFEGKVSGAESVAVAPDGTLVMLDKYGYVHRARQADSDGDDALHDAGYVILSGPPFYIGPGRPLGFHVVDGGASLIACDSIKGLIRINLSSGEVCVLSNRVSDDSVSGNKDGARDARAEINYANDLDIVTNADDNGVQAVYFSSSTEGTVEIHPDGYYDTMRSFLLNMCRGDRSGRLLRYTPSDGRTSVLVDGLWYANGVAVAHGGQSVLVVETMGFRVLEHHLAGPLAGTTTTLIDKLPGFPDGITRSSDGNYWVCLVAPLSPLLMVIQLNVPFLQYLLARLMTSGLASRFIKRWGCVVKVSPKGEVLSTLMDPSGEHVSTVSAVTEFPSHRVYRINLLHNLPRLIPKHDGMLFLGNLFGDFVSVVDLADITDDRHS